MNQFKPAPPKAWCNKCGKALIPGEITGNDYWINTGKPNYWVVTMRCPSRKERWFIFTAINREHTDITFYYPVKDNEKLEWFLPEWEYSVLGERIRLKDRKEWKVVGTADKLESFIETGKQKGD